MFLSFLLFTVCFQVIAITAQEISVVRHIDGDIFTVKGPCTSACSDVSSSTASPYQRQTSMPNRVTASSTVNATCVCQCKSGLQLFREDLNICVNDIPECSVTGFVSSYGHVEKIPYVFLPQRGQIIYPQAEIQFQGVTAPVCGIAGAQQLGKSGWSEFRNLSSIESPFKLFKDEGKTFLQWIGEGGLRDAAEGKVVIVRLVCRDASLNPLYRGVFTPCVAFRVAGSPSKNNIREVSFVSNAQSQAGLSTIEYTAIGISSVLLALIYIASVSLYLHSRKSRRRAVADPEVVIKNSHEVSGIVKSNPLLRHFESDSNSIRSECEDDGNTHDDVGEFEKITSAVVHSHTFGMNDQLEGSFGSSIIAERLPEEDVRIVETVDSQQDILNVVPGAQRKKLYFNPAYFDKQLLLAPPPAAIEFLLKIREVIAIAKHKLAAKRFIPSLTAIEEETTSDRCSLSNKRPGSVQSSVTRSKTRSQKCSGCPGCLESRRNEFSASLPDNSRPIPGESRVRAWLECLDIKPPERRRNPEEIHKHIHHNFQSFAKSLEYLKDVRKDLLRIDQKKFDRSSPTCWKDSPLHKSFQHIAHSDILGDDDRNSISHRSTKSMFEDTNYDRYCRTRRCNLQACNIGPDDPINEKVRKAIENSFIKQMEENAAIESQIIASKNSSERFSPDGSSENNLESLNSMKIKNIETLGKRKKNRAPVPPNRELPDMINELPTAKLQAKRIMDAVIKEMVDVKALDHHGKIAEVDYEVDSLERMHKQRLDRQKNSEISKCDNRDIEENENIMRKNLCNNLPELISSRSEGYSLVSEVYVNDGYASPANSDDSGPEICYEPEHPGHLTIKVQDSPQNYVKCDESEYEPDTLDRKPMKLKINGDVIYDKEQTTNEIYVDSLERPTQIMLRSKGSFRDDLSRNGSSLSRGYGSLREIYEARLRSNVDANLEIGSLTGSHKDSLKNNSMNLKSKYLTPDFRQAKRQRKQNQPDVVPLPPLLGDNVYQQPKPPRRIDESHREHQKNERDRSVTDAGNPTASGSSPVLNKKAIVGARRRRDNLKPHRKIHQGKYEDSGYLSSTDDSSESTKHINDSSNKLVKKQICKYDFGSVSETDETESICDGASESGAESIGTDSVFFDNFKRLSHTTNFKSMDSGVDLGVRKSYFSGSEIEGRAYNHSDSENESFVTVLTQASKSRSNLGLS